MIVNILDNGLAELLPAASAVLIQQQALFELRMT
jgi:hypothetical protein